MIVKLLTENHLEFVSLKGVAQARLSLHLSKCHIVRNHMLRLIFDFVMHTSLLISHIKVIQPEYITQHRYELREGKVFKRWCQYRDVSFWLKLENNALKIQTASRHYCQKCDFSTKIQYTISI